MTDSLKFIIEKNKGKPKIIEVRPFKLSMAENFDLTDEQQENLDRILKSFLQMFYDISKMDLLKVKKLKIL